jgi:NDP-sugar pyrophosphorylase family protein
MPPALILAAGLGTRLRPLTLVRAKAAVPIAGEPLVRRIAAWLRTFDITDLVLNLHHLPGSITAVVGDGSDLGVRVRYSWEQPVVLGSAGGPRRALPILGSRTFLIVNGDTLADVDVRALLAAHAGSGALVTLALVPNREPMKYGGVMIDAEGRVTGFVRAGPAAMGSLHFTGIQAADAAAFSEAPDDRPSQSIGGVYDQLLAGRPGAVGSFVTEASFWDVGTAADYWATSMAFGDGQVQCGRGARVDPGARLDSCILWDDVEVGAGAVLDQCIIADGVRIPPGARMQRSVVTRAGTGAPIVTPY